MRLPAHRGREGGEPPTDTRVRGAGPARKTFVAPKAWTAPHPLQPIVRRAGRLRTDAERRTDGGAPPGVVTEVSGQPAFGTDNHRRGNLYR
jgi:hypothetical protein